MTTRPPLGTHRPPQSSLNGNVQVAQKPQSLRNYSSSTQIRRAEERVDQVAEGESPHGPAKNARPNFNPSRSASAVGSPNVVEAAPKYPRGQPRLHFDIHPLQIKVEDDTSSLSPAAPDLPDNGPSIPLPVRPGRQNRPTVTKQRTQPTSTARKDARPKPYILEVPAIAPHYPPNGESKCLTEFVMIILRIIADSLGNLYYLTRLKC